jgi:hypothetical protein
MIAPCYRRHRFPGLVIQHAVWLYLRFSLSYRDVEELLAERGVDVSYEAIRQWVLKVGPVFARRQPGGEFASGRPSTRTEDAALQIGRVGATFPRLPRGRLQHLQPSAPSRLPLGIADDESCGLGAMAGSDGRLKTSPAAVLRSGGVKLTMPRLQVELFSGLRRDELHPRALHRLGDHRCIAEVVLLPLRIGANVFPSSPRAAGRSVGQLRHK